MAYWERPDFLALQQAWYARLANTGFVDVEISQPYDCRHRHRHDRPRHVLILLAEQRRIYHRELASRLETALFAKPADQIIMQMRSEGARINEICAKLDALGMPKHRHRVRFRIRIYEMKWGLRTYTPRQIGHKAG